MRGSKTNSLRSLCFTPFFPQATCSWSPNFFKECTVKRGSLQHNHGWHLHTVSRRELRGRSPVVGQHREWPQLGVSGSVCTRFPRMHKAVEMTAEGPSVFSWVSECSWSVWSLCSLRMIGVYDKPTTFGMVCVCVCVRIDPLEVVK